MKNSVRGLLLVTGGMIAGALISASLAAPERAARSVHPLDEIRQFTDIYGAVKQYYVDPVEDKKLMKEAISGMLQGLDPHSAYLDENAFNVRKALRAISAVLVLKSAPILPESK